MTEKEQSEFISKATEVFKESENKVIFIAGQITAAGLNVAIGVDTLSTSLANNIYSHNHFLIFGLENVENINALVNALKPLYQPKYPLVLVFDSDEKGLAEQSVEALKREKVEYVLYPIEIMRKEGIKKSITHIAETLQDNIATKELENINVGKQIKNYLKSIEESASAPAIKTGFDEFDSSLGGGLRAGRLYGIGGITSLGKTTFALQIADNIAQKRQDVLIFSLEMDRQEMISKSISRRTFSLNKKDKNKAISPQDILDPVKRKEHLDILAEAVGDYSTHWAKQVNIAEGVGDIGVKEIRRSVDNFLVKKGSRPVVFIDYLQILAPYNERLSDKQNIDKSVLELKRIARDYQIPVIAINSFNRSNYLSEASFEAFKESGAIEYSCDVLIALQLKIDGRDKWTESSPSLNEKRNKINEAKIASPREVEAIILKNRGYKAYAKITFRYLPEYDYFEENSSNF